MAILSAQELSEKLSEMVGRLRGALSPVAIYVLGSYAYGQPTAHSDIDLLVIVEESELDPYERDGQAYLALCGLQIPKDVQVYTRLEFEQEATLPGSFARTVKGRGRLIYEA